MINLITGALPAKFTKYDLSKSGLCTIGEETKEVLASLSEDVTLYFLTKSGSEDTTIETLLKEYESESGRVHVKKVDIIADPTFTPAYTEDTVPANSVIVECGEKFRIIDYYDIYMTDMQNGYSAEFDGEGQITSAIASVSSGEHSAACVTTGHGEILLSKSMQDALAKAGAHVDVVVRRKELKAEIEQHAYGYRNLAQWDHYAYDKYSYVFNTIPAMVLDAGHLQWFSPSILIYDIASSPGGTDFAYCKAHGIRADIYLGIPGKLYPKEAGTVIASGIYEHALATETPSD